jgi:hypothetical protein
MSGTGYNDTVALQVLNGCLEAGGEAMVEDFIRSTSGWSEFFLNDAPMARLG